MIIAIIIMIMIIIKIFKAILVMKTPFFPVVWDGWIMCWEGKILKSVGSGIKWMALEDKEDKRLHGKI